MKGAVIMLNTIKELIGKQKVYQEAADLLLENEDLDDAIILNEGPEEIENPDIKDEEPVNEPENPVVPGNDDLPEPVGKQTGEPIEAGVDDILGIELDLATNTQKDVLPTPPVNAGEAIADDDILSQKIDSGFGDAGNGEPEQVGAPIGSSDTDDILDQPIEDEDSGAEEPPKESEPKLENNNFDLLSEAISIGEEPAPAGDTSAEEPPKDEGEVPAEPVGDDTPPDDNPVTSAVKDKVAEMDSEPEAAGGETTTDARDAILKKLGALTKSVEDAKKMVMDNIR